MLYLKNKSIKIIIIILIIVKLSNLYVLYIFCIVDHSIFIFVSDNMFVLNNEPVYKKKWPCPVCTKVFTLAANRSRHLRTSDCGGSKVKYVCFVCYKCFTRSDTLKTHLLLSHQIK